MERPLHTYEQNVQGTASLLTAMEAAGVARIVFSSSAAVYGTPDTDLVTERTATTPESPYGASKLVGEWMLRDVGRASALTHTSLRYFNVVGSAMPDLYDTSPHNLFPVVIRALREGRRPRIYGDDYPTPDGTCVRDYVHVADLADAHVAAARRLVAGEPLEPVYNLGSGEGVSVRQIMSAFAAVTGTDVDPEVVPRRRGTRRASWRPRSWPRATWAGRCGTPSSRWWPRPGRPRATERQTRRRTAVTLPRIVAWVPSMGE